MEGALKTSFRSRGAQFANGGTQVFTNIFHTHFARAYLNRTSFMASSLSLSLRVVSRLVRVCIYISDNSSLMLSPLVPIARRACRAADTLNHLELCGRYTGSD